jgi:hypothetical protein
VANNPPRKVDIKGQPHMLAYITPEEGGILQLLGGSGKPGPMGIPSFFVDDFGDFSSVDASDTSSPSVDDGSSYSDDSASDTSATYSVDDSGQETDSFSLAEPSVYGTDAGLSDAAITSIGVPAGSGTDSQFFGGPDYNVMDFGRGSVSNITNATNYDPNFAAINQISRGLTPSFNLRNQIDFDVPASMLPQLEGRRGPLAPKYYSGVERFMQETLPDIVTNIPGPMNLLGKALDSITGAVDKGKSFFSDPIGGFKSTGDFFSGIFDSTPGRDFMQNDDSGDNVAFDSRGQNVFRDDRPGRTSDPVPEISEEERLRLEEEKRRQQELERQRRLNQLYDMSRDATMFQVASDAPRLQVGPFSTNLAPSGGILDNFGVNLANVEENIRNINRLNI